jgi:hypothetical protein
MGQPAQALALGQIALSAHDKSLGADHAWTKDSAGTTADALDALGRSEEAKALRERYGRGTDNATISLTSLRWPLASGGMPEAKKSRRS